MALESLSTNEVCESFVSRLLTRYRDEGEGLCASLSNFTSMWRRSTP